MMNTIIAKIAGPALFMAILGMIISGCAQHSGQAPKSFEENFRFVPRVHVEDNSFGMSGGGEYWGCSYDQLYEGYWCPR